jgi:NitT/TauT family transport system ATP-binding protein
LSDPTNDFIVARDLRLTYRTKDTAVSVEALRDVNCSIGQGSVAAIIGPSGCGKTTLLNCIGGLLRTGGGMLTIGGKSPDEARRARAFGLVPQDASLFEWKTVFDNIILPFRIFENDIGREQLEERVHGLIRLVGLQGFEKAYPRQLSGGMRQRASLARALSFNPPVLLMDEPFGSLDAQTREEMNVEVLRIWSEIRNTMILITHDVTEAVMLADRVFVMSRRPSTIRTVIEVDIPRPRERAVLDSPLLHGYVRQIRELLYS